MNTKEQSEKKQIIYIVCHNTYEDINMFFTDLKQAKKHLLELSNELDEEIRNFNIIPLIEGIEFDARYISGHLEYHLKSSNKQEEHRELCEEIEKEKNEYDRNHIYKK